MVKTLRSLVLEKIPKELRVELDLLSRRRNLQNREKVDQILKLLRKFAIGDFTQLGSGTNRYAIRFEGFVVKIALDNDGKVDNLSEFSWSKFLYPRVPMVHEVTENGLLLVCEYVQPFMTMSEMQQHAEEIRRILKDLSAICLIGDVGIASVNYANWGVRPGAEEAPVCLDFAYIYEVRSRILLCRHCSAGSVLIPDDDYNALYCPTCKTKVLFSELRSRISREDHMKEISDMDKKGYLLTESKVPTELVPQKSQWLLHPNKKKKGKKQPNQTYQEIDTETNQEEYEMSYDKYEAMARGFDWNRFQSIAVAAEVVEEPDANDVVIDSVAYDIGEAEPELSPEMVQEAEGMVPPNLSDVDAVMASFNAHNAPVQEAPQPAPMRSEVVPEPVQPFVPDPVPAETVVEAVIQKEAEEETVQTEAPQVVEAPAPKRPPRRVPTPQEQAFTPHFLEHVFPACSKIANRIASDLEHADLWTEVRVHVNERKLFKGNFFERLQNSIFYSLLDYAEFTSVFEEKNGKRRRVYTAPESFIGLHAEPTMIFIGRYWNRNELNQIEKAAEIMPKYRELYKDYQGLQSDWTDICMKNLQAHCKITPAGCDVVQQYLLDRWCVPDSVEEAPEPEPQPDLESSAVIQAANAAVEEAATQLAADKEEPLPVAEEPQYEMATIPPDSQSGLAFSSDPDAPAEEVETDDDDDDDVEEIEGSRTLSVIIDEFNYQNSHTVITIHSYTGSTHLNVPFHVERNWLQKTRAANYRTVYAGNGIWDWLTHFQPDMISLAESVQDAQRLLGLNPTDTLPDELKMIHVVIGGTNGKFCVGTYFVGDLMVMDEYGEVSPIDDIDYVMAINHLVMATMEGSPISRRDWNIRSCPEETYITVDRVLEAVEFVERGQSIMDGEPDDEDEEDEKDDFEESFVMVPDRQPSTRQPSRNTALEDAALAAMAAGGSPVPSTPQPSTSKVFKPIGRIREEDRKYPPRQVEQDPPAAPPMSISR